MILIFTKIESWNLPGRVQEDLLDGMDTQRVGTNHWIRIWITFPLLSSHSYNSTLHSKLITLKKRIQGKLLAECAALFLLGGAQVRSEWISINNC